MTFYEIRVNGRYYDEWYYEGGLKKLKVIAAEMFPGKSIKITPVRH